jgi:hypothetical protein
MMMCIPCISRELQVFKIIFIYVNFFIEFIGNEKVEEGDKEDDDV